MNRILAAAALFLAIIAWHADAHAACTTTTTFLPDGRVITCTVCCQGGMCMQQCF